ncbi:hypothetical protein F8S13_05085 [Chloroflexia bacterium SDU3-3]|nr:hypothetical protein F8S13_05085 [Chloroflexia bacterium SDU3-3]
MNFLLRAFGLAATGLALVGCGTAPAAALPSAPAAAPAAAAVATSAPPTLAPATAAPTAAPQPTAAPTAAAQAAQPTATAAPPAPSATLAPTPTKQQLVGGQPGEASAPAAAPAPTGRSEILFLRAGALTALDPQAGSERVIAEGVSDFAAARGADLIALVRGAGQQAEIWVVRRDGSGLRQLTSDSRADVTPSIAVDGSAVAFASASATKPYARQWPDWGQWCATSEVRLIELATGEQRTLGQGCDPAISPDLKRVVFATPPTDSLGEFPHSATNTIRMVNRQGQNGWSFAKAPNSSGSGLVVYAPSWSADGSKVLFHRFLGYQALVDLGMSELALTFKGGGEPVYSGAGWQLPAAFSPDAAQVAIAEDNYSDARGLTGYGTWSVTAVTLSGSRSVALPEGSVTLIGSRAETLRLAQGGAWSPDGAALAVILPAGWRPDVAEDAQGAEPAPGELWRWQPGSRPSQKLADRVDFASPVVWLP